METTLNPIAEIKKRVVDFVNAKEFFKNIQVIMDEKGDVDTQIAEKLSVLGLAVVFECIDGRIKYPAVGSSVVDLKAAFTITENVLINRDENNTGKSGKVASDVLCEILAIFNPMGATEALPLILEDFQLVNNTGSTVIYQINGKAPTGWKQVQQ